MLQFTGAPLSTMQAVMELQKHYPESVAKLASVNCNWISLACWNTFVSAIVPAHTKDKVLLL